MNRLSLQRFDGPLTKLGPGQWTELLRETANVAFLRCPECGSGADINEDSIAPDGTVNDEFICQAPVCSFNAMLMLDGWTAAPVFDTSDVT